jgi:hypothetical protein
MDRHRWPRAAQAILAAGWTAPSEAIRPFGCNVGGPLAHGSMACGPVFFFQKFVSSFK